MKYLCLVFYGEKKRNELSDKESQALIDESLDFDDALRREGYFIAAGPLQPVEAATTVRVRNDEVSVTDGPFTETNEQIAGFVLIEARDLNDAIRVVSRIPPARLGGSKYVRCWIESTAGKETTINRSRSEWRIAILCGQERTRMCPICLLIGSAIVVGAGSAGSVGVGITKMIRRFGYPGSSRRTTRDSRAGE